MFPVISHLQWSFLWISALPGFLLYKVVDIFSCYCCLLQLGAYCELMGWGQARVHSFKTEASEDFQMIPASLIEYTNIWQLGKTFSTWFILIVINSKSILEEKNGYILGIWRYKLVSCVFLAPKLNYQMVQTLKIKFYSAPSLI